MTKRESIVIYRNQLEAMLSTLETVDDFRSVIRAMIDYGLDGVPVEVPPHLRFGWEIVRWQIDHVNEQYNAICEKRREYGKLGVSKRKQMQANGSNCKQMVAIGSKCQQMPANAADNDNDNHNDNDNEGDKSPNIKRAGEDDLKKYPQTVDDVLAIAHSPQCGVPMTRESAEDYFNRRMSRDWVDASNRKIKPEQLVYDLKVWHINHKSEPLRKTEQFPPKEYSAKGYSDLEQPPEDWEECYNR